MKITLENCRWERQKCVSRDLSAAAIVIDPLILLLALTGTQNLRDIPTTAAQSPLPPTNTCKSFLAPNFLEFQNVNNGGDESFVACSSIGSVWTKLIFGLESEKSSVLCFKL